MAVVFAGTTLKRRRVGMVADFCPICRRARECDLLRVGVAAHLYWISFGEGRLAGYEARCPECRVRWPIEHDMDPDRWCEQDGARDRRIREGRQRVQRFEAGRLTAEEREAMLEEPFLVLEPMVKEQGKYRQLNRTGTVAGLVTLGIGAVFLWGLKGGWGDRAPEPLAAALGIVWLAALFVTAWVVFGPLRWYRKEVVEPALVRALRPLEPTREELEALLRGFRLRGKLVAKLVTPARLHALLEAA